MIDEIGYKKNLIDSLCMHIQHHQNIATCIIFRSGKLIFYLFRLTYLICVDWCRLLFLWNYFFILGIRWLREFVKNCFPINKLYSEWSTMLATGALYIETSNISSSYDITPQVIIKKSFIRYSKYKISPK